MSKQDIIGKKFDVLDDGFIRVIDAMGDDSAIVQAARISYGEGTKKVSEDRALIRYLMRNHHSSPFEMCEIKLHVRVPMDCWRQWIRHRTACLAGDTFLEFDLPSAIKGNRCQLYSMSVEDIYRKFQPTTNTVRPDKQRNPYFKRDRVQNMRLRCINESTLGVDHTNIVDIWQSGVKKVYLVTLEDGSHAEMTMDHLCYTDASFHEGWLRLEDVLGGAYRIFSVGPGKNSGVSPLGNTMDELTEQWKPIPDWEDYYQVSSQGRVRRIIGGKGSRSYGRCKTITYSNGRAVTSLNSPGKQETEFIHVLMLKAFVGEKPAGMEGCHNDGNALNNVIENLRWGTPQSNADDRVRDGATTRLQAKPQKIKSVHFLGEKMTYDLEVIGPWHNFSAGGMIVHNSVNEYSTRYSIAIDAMQQTAPHQWRLQSGSNKQGSHGYADGMVGEVLSLQERSFHEEARRVYQDRIADGIAREQARKDLPLSTFTEAYWKIDLHNLLHFLTLRMDAHAQEEIRAYATIIGNDIVRHWCPLTWEAFEDYRLQSMTLSRRELRALAQGLNPEWFDAETLATCNGLVGREKQEFLAKVAQILTMC